MRLVTIPIEPTVDARVNRTAGGIPMRRVWRRIAPPHDVMLAALLLGDDGDVGCFLGETFVGTAANVFEDCATIALAMVASAMQGGRRVAGAYTERIVMHDGGPIDMGAQTFEQFQTGDDVFAAFERAVEAAAWEHGHGGYTGTLAEKDSFVVIDKDGDTVHAKLGSPYYPVSAWGAARRDITYPPLDPLPWDAASALADRLIEQRDARIDDKWGPAGAIPAVGADGQRGWLFFGWASS